jgi:hypothetical protein
LPGFSVFLEIKINKKRHLMKKFQKIILAIGSLGIIATAPAAYAVPFTITDITITPGGGYGQTDTDNVNNGKGGILLDARFPTTILDSSSFELTAAGQSNSFDLGLVSLYES